MKNRLPLAIICQAVRDYIEPRREIEHAEYYEAVRFIEDEWGAWAKSREIICDYANICPKKLRTKVMAAKKSGLRIKQILAGLL